MHNLRADQDSTVVSERVSQRGNWGKRKLIFFQEFPTEKKKVDEKKNISPINVIVTLSNDL